MPKLNPILICVCALVAMIATASPHQALGAWQDRSDEIVVLNNRQTFSGIVTQQPNTITVALPSGSRIVFPNSKVMFVAKTLAESYWELAARTRSTDLFGQIEVFQWCLTNHQFEEASNHLLMLQEMPIPAKKLMQLDVSLQITQKRFLASQTETDPVAIENENRSNQQSSDFGGETISIAGLPPVDSIRIPDLKSGLASSPTTKRVSPIDRMGGFNHAAQPGPEFRRLPVGPTNSTSPTSAAAASIAVIDQYGNEVKPMVQQVSFDQPINDPHELTNVGVAGDGFGGQPSSITTNARPLPQVDSQIKRRLRSSNTLAYSDLDRLTRSMPKGSVGLFRKQVEPLLQRSCRQCHRSSGDVSSDQTAFEIHQAINGSINRRMSQKNLFQALNLSDQRQPESSLLIRYATTAHGGQPSASFDLEDSKLLPLKRWLIMISENPFLPVENFSSDNVRAFPPTEGDSLNPASEMNAASQRIATPDSQFSEKPATDQSATQPNTGRVQSMDPFEGDIFNQRYLRSK